MKTIKMSKKKSITSFFSHKFFLKIITKSFPLSLYIYIYIYFYNFFFFWKDCFIIYSRSRLVDTKEIEKPPKSHHFIGAFWSYYINRGHFGNTKKNPPRGAFFFITANGDSRNFKTHGNKNPLPTLLFHSFLGNTFPLLKSISHNNLLLFCFSRST